jgi:hypothetical protein
MKLRWHLEVSTHVDTPKYRKTVEDLVGPIMDWLCERMAENDLTTFEKVEDLFKQIMDELPIMRLLRRSDYNEHYVGPDFFIKYNKNTDIIFEDNAACIRRELIIDNLLK